jgi:hypothetical protein
MNLSQHFTLGEFTASQSAARAGLDNTLPPSLYANARRVCERLERVREVLRVPIVVSSGYRCPALNTLIGGAPESRHQLALAADITAPEFGAPITVARAIIGAGIGFDLLIYEFGTWVHVGLAPEGEPERHEVLHIDHGGGYLPGLP